MAGHRGNGEGSIFQEGARSGRTDGRWVAQISMDGRLVRRFASTQAKAKRRLRELQAQVSAGESPGHGNVTVGQLLENWRSTALPARELSARTIDVYEWCIEVLTEVIGSHRADRLTAEDVERKFRQLAESGREENRRPISRASLVKIRSVLGKALDYGIRRQLVARNVARVVELPVAAKRTRPGRSLTVEQANTLLEASRGDRLAPLWRLMLMTGLRPGEATGLSWSDVDLGGGVIHVRRSLKLQRGELIVTGDLKTSRSRRSLSVDHSVVKALEERRKAQVGEKRAVGAAWSNEEDLVFTTSAGSPIDPNNLRRSFARLTERAGLGRWHPHELRHSTTSILSAAGVPIERIADVLGHDGTRMTSLVYRHSVSPTVDEAAIMGEALGIEGASP